MLEDTLVIWGGEFGRTVYCQGHLTAADYGRDLQATMLHCQGIDHKRPTYRFQGRRTSRRTGTRVG